MKCKGKRFSAQKRGELRRRRNKRAERRAATALQREAYNEQMREQGHPGWSTDD